jgi:zona occludens toxin (predicted ATPase)
MDEDIEYHVQRIKAIQNYIRHKGNLAYRVFLRATGAINNHDGSYTIRDLDIKAWFESGSYLKQFTDHDTL